MKNQIIAVPSGSATGTFNAECAISGHRFADETTGKPRVFADANSVEQFGAKLLSKPLTDTHFKACAHALLKRHGATVLYEDASYSGIQTTFALHTRYGPAEVVPLETWILFRFLDPAFQNFPWGTVPGDKGSCNLHKTGELRELLGQFAQRLALCAMPPAAGSRAPATRAGLADSTSSGDAKRSRLLRWLLLPR